MRKNYKQIFEERIASINAMSGGNRFRIVQGQTSEATYAVVLEGRGVVSDYLPAAMVEQFLLGMLRTLSLITHK